MQIRIAVLLLLLLSGFKSEIANPDTVIIHAGKLLAVPGQAPLREQTIVIKSGRITSVVAGYKTSKSLGESDAMEVDLKDMYVMPGFIDAHTHISTQRNPNRNPHEWLTRYDSEETLASIPYLRNTLRAGFTTVRNLGSYYKIILPLKRAIGSGIIEGPRIIAATGSIAATGGHGDFHGYRDEVLEIFGESVGICDGADDCRRAVRALVKQGAEVIKISSTGGVLSNTNAGVDQQLTDDELVAIVETANQLGRKVAAHAHGAQGVNAALRAGVHSIEHGSFLDDESIRLFKSSGAFLVPTLLAGVTLEEEMKTNPRIPPAVRKKMEDVIPVIENSFKKALKAGVKMAFGTDSGVSAHGTNAREFELLVEYGMTPMDAIKMATINASQLLGKESELGSIEEGKWGDLVAVRGDPVQDISILREVKFVMKEGVVYRHEQK